MLTDLVQIRRLGEKKLDENKRLRQHLKRHNFVERRLKHLAQKIEDQIDCMAFANCSRVATTRITERDVDKLVPFLGIGRTQFLQEYTVVREIARHILKRTDS